MSENAKHPVGYCSPPVQHRFKKGKSGNPRGRPRKQDDLWSHMNRVLSRKVKLQGSDDQIPIREALIRRLRELALAGDRRALELQRRILAEAAGAADVDRFDPEEEKRKVVEVLRRIAAAMKKDGGGDA
ncbi:hypothetical protein LX70_01746 [Defluviimonas denitrificans]|jgi:hypothetical protein|uniref:DUF5681 domain-containing protein n=1 Tax=Albidovulum denitrificans TaxID=404881 RepID=A0A2S8SAV3_9RHOB|nr:DUF5681 domain-containing protein [Defluviimonas denitrificans]PQV57934.1 hypothetical protein LX70_01746 [Defluviimonas denitrificans]